MCGRYVIKNPVLKTNKLVKSAIQVDEIENYNAHPYQKLPVIKKYKNGNTLENLKWGLIPSWAKEKNFKALINALKSLSFTQFGINPHFKFSKVFPFLYFFITGSFLYG